MKFALTKNKAFLLFNKMDMTSFPLPFSDNLNLKRMCFPGLQQLECKWRLAATLRDNSPIFEIQLKVIIIGCCNYIFHP